MCKYLCTVVYHAGMLNNVQISRVHPTNLLDIKRMVGRIRERIGRERKREPASASCDGPTVEIYV